MLLTETALREKHLSCGSVVPTSLIATRNKGILIFYLAHGDRRR